MASRQSLQHRLVLYVSIVLVLLSLLWGLVLYRLAYDHELSDAAAIEQQVVATIQAQAEVAVFAANNSIAEGVIEGLRANPRILAVRILGEAATPFNVGAGAIQRTQDAPVTEYPLFSPIDSQKRIGKLNVTRNDPLIRAEATMNALRQVLLLLLLIGFAAVLIMLFTRYLIGRPVADLAARLAAIKPGSGERISVPATHENDEIGSLANSANALIKAAEDALAEVQALATTDALTNLPNRRAFMGHINNEHARVKRYELPPASVLMLDIDFFKHVNDQYGHAAGDAVLQRFGTLLAGELRSVDNAGRLGGEEFAVLLPGTDLPSAAIFAERLRALVAETPIPHGGAALRITVSVGIAALTSSVARPDDALALADNALYRAKHEGRNRVVIHDAARADKPA